MWRGDSHRVRLLSLSSQQEDESSFSAGQSCFTFGTFPQAWTESLNSRIFLFHPWNSLQMFVENDAKLLSIAPRPLVSAGICLLVFNAADDKWGSESVKWPPAWAAIQDDWTLKVLPPQKSIFRKNNKGSDSTRASRRKIWIYSWPLKHQEQQLRSEITIILQNSEVEHVKMFIIFPFLSRNDKCSWIFEKHLNLRLTKQSLALELEARLFPPAERRHVRCDQTTWLKTLALLMHH